MNERIRELADKIWAEEYWDNPATDKLLPAQLNKFAKLVATDCAEIARDIGTDTNPDDWALDKCYEIEERIRDRYGVEQ